MAAKMLVNRATGLVREPLSHPKRVGKTAKDRAKRSGIGSKSESRAVRK